MEWGELECLMIEIHYWVKRVNYTNPETTGSHPWKGVNRVSSYYKPAKCIGMFLAVAALVSGSAGIVSASDIVPQKIIDLANADRKAKGIQELEKNEKLSQAAAAKANDMMLNDYFSHTSPQGTTPWYWIEKENYDYNYAGENLAMDFTTAEKMNDAWMESPTHRANILNEKYKEIGVAVKEGKLNGHVTIVAVQMFGSGDKNKIEAKEDDKVTQKEEMPDRTDFIPALPIEKTVMKKIVFANPSITSPQENEILNKKKISITGRANPKSQVTIFDDGQAVGESFADENGWFRLEVKDISEGKHDLTAQAEKFSAGKKETRFSGRVSFKIDRQKPTLGYRLYADNQKNRFLVSLMSDKKNCNFELGEKRTLGSEGAAATFSVEANQSSIVATVSDQAGNKTKKQIVLANYFTGNGKSIFENLAFSMLFQTAVAADSGREALAANLGIAPHQLISSH